METNKKRPAIPSSFVSSDPSAQFKLQQEQQIKQEFENKVKKKNVCFF